MFDTAEQSDLRMKARQPRHRAEPDRDARALWNEGIRMAEVEAHRSATVGSEPSSSRSLDLTNLTVDDVQAGFASGAFTAQSLVEASLDRVARYNPKYNAIILLNPSALDDAKEMDRRRAAGEYLGPLASVPVVVKDTIDMAGFPTTAGWSLLCGKMGGIDLLPERDAPVVARLREAGAVIIGKTNVPILGGSGTHANNSWAGPTLNVVVPDRVPGASSSGTASAVASAMVVLGLAGETSGSIQNPASAQDLVGIKPTIGLAPNAGVLPLSGNLDVVGPLARCVRDAAICLDVLAGYTSEDPKTLAGVGRKPKGGYTSKLSVDALKGTRLALYGGGWRNEPLSMEAEQLYDRAKEELEGLGAVLMKDPFAGSGFADLRKPTPPFASFDSRGLECFPYDLHKYLDRLGPKAALQTFGEFAKATEKENPFGPRGVLNYLPNLPQFAAVLATRRNRRISVTSLRSRRNISRYSRKCLRPITSTPVSFHRCFRNCRRCTGTSTFVRRRPTRSTLRAFRPSPFLRATTPRAHRSA